MKNNTSFLHRFFLCALFCLSTTASMASTRTFINVDSDSDEEDHSIKISRESYIIDSFAELEALFLEHKITWGPDVAAFFDNDETISWSIWNSHIKYTDPFNPFLYLCCPDLVRTYRDTLEAAATLLQGRDDSKSVADYIANLEEANLWMLTGPDFWRHRHQPLEKEALAGVLALARESKTYVKICSGLDLTEEKYCFFDEHKDDFGFTLPKASSRASEGFDYLCAGRFGKAGRTAMDLAEAFGGADSSLKTIILFDNSPGACAGFLKQMTKRQLREVKGVSESVRVISVQYDAFANRITPQLVADEYERYVLFFQARRIQQAAAQEAGSGSDTDYETDIHIKGYTSSDEDSGDEGSRDNGDFDGAGLSLKLEGLRFTDSGAAPAEDEQDDPAPLKDDEKDE